MYKYILAFLVAAGLSPTQVTPTHLLTFLQYLHENNMSASNVDNYISAVRTINGKFGLSTASCIDQ